MAYIILQHRWRRQPQTPVGIDWSNPLTRGLWVAYVLPVMPYEIVRGLPLADLVGAKRPTHGDGLGAIYKNWTNNSSLNGKALNDGYTCFLRFRTDSTLGGSSNKGAFGLWDSSYNFGFYQDHTNSAYRGAFWVTSSFTNIGQPTGGALSASTDYTLAVSQDSTTSSWLYNNGRESSGSAVSHSTGTTTEVSVGSTRKFDIEASSDSYFSAVYFWFRRLSSGEHRALAEAPYQFFRPLRRRIWVPSAPAGTNISVGAGALTLTGAAPTVTTQESISVGAGALTITGYAPSVTTQQSVSVGLGELTLTGYAPTVSTTTDTAISVGAGALTLTGQAPTVTTQEAIPVGAGALTITGYEPSVALAGQTNIQVGAGALTLTGQAPTVTTAEQISVDAGALTLTGYAPIVVTNTAISVGAGALTIAGYAPTLSITLPISVDASQIVLTGYAPTVLGGEATVVTPTEQPVGGWPRRRPAIDRRVPTEEEVRRERERLGILPPRAQKVLRRIVAEISDEPELEHVAEALKPEPLAERVRKELRDSGAYFQKRNADIYPQIIAALVLDSLQRKGALDAELLAEQQEADLVNNVLLPMWLNL